MTDAYLYIIGTTVVAVIVFLTSFFCVKFWAENDQKKKLLEMKYNAKSVILPLRLQAYERMAMFLERIEPNQLIIRINNDEFSAMQLRNLLLTSIRAEFEHNLSQQIYISAETWQQIVAAKEEIIQLINLAFGKMPEEASGLELVSAVLEQCAATSPVEQAMTALKKEINVLF